MVEKRWDVRRKRGSAFAEKVEGFFYFLRCGRLIDTYVADVCEQREVDFGCSVLLVVPHQVDEGVVMVAGNVQCAVVFADETHRLVQLLSGESCLFGREIKLTDKTESHGIAVQ